MEHIKVGLFSLMISFSLCSLSLSFSFRMKKASEAALQCAEKQHLKFYPEYHSNLWRHWLQSNRYEILF